MADFVSTVPMGRGSTPTDIANAACYLASDEAGFITGIDLTVGLLGRPEGLGVKSRAHHLYAFADTF